MKVAMVDKPVNGNVAMACRSSVSRKLILRRRDTVALNPREFRPLELRD
jgi:hypothetical protein